MKNYDIWRRIMDNKKIGYKDVFTQTEYVKMMFAALINRFGDSIDAIASTWIVYQLTSSAAWSALIFGINNLPTVVVTPLAGAWVEGRNKKRIMIVTDLIRAVVVATVASLFLLNLLQPWMLLISTITISTAEAFRGPANTAITPNILDEEMYEFGMSLKDSLSQIVQLIGLGCAAGIIALIGISGALYIDMATFIISAAIILFVNTKETITEKVAFNVKNYVTDLAEGVKYVSKEAVIVFFLWYAVFLNSVLVPLNGLQAPMVEEILHSGVEALSVFSITFTAGMLLGAVVFPYVSKKIGNVAIFWGMGIIISGYYILMVALQPLYVNQWVTYAVLSVLSIVTGMIISIANSMISVIFMKKVEKKYIARAAAIMTAFSVAAMPITSFLVSAVVTVISVKTIFIISGVLAFLVTALMSRKAYLLSDDEPAPAISCEESVETDVEVNSIEEAI
jgi:MFS family permease